MMQGSLRNFTSTFAQMLRLDLSIFKKVVSDRIINAAIFCIAYSITVGYIMPAFGLQKEFGLVMAAGLVAISGMFELFMAVINFTADLHGPRIIYYYLMLPVPAWVVLAKMAVYSAISAGTVAITIVPLTKILFWNSFSLENVAWAKLAIIFVFMELLFGVFALFLSTFIKDMGRISNAWMRIVFPLQMFAGFQFTWKSLYSLHPRWAMLDLLNPFLYAFEGTRSALLGPKDYLPFWGCIGALGFFIIFFFLISLKRLKKMLDYV
jgi:ABC-2 type transport system permease protein